MKKKALKIAGVTTVVLMSLVPGLPILQEDMNQTCIEPASTMVDLNSWEDCKVQQIQLQHFDTTNLTVSGATLVRLGK